MSTPEPPKQRKRGGIDETLILDSSRKRSRREGSSEGPVDTKANHRSTRNGSAPLSLAVLAETPATDPAGFEAVRKKGLSLWEKLTNVEDPEVEGRLSHLDFMKLPSKAEYPDYYMTIKKPIAFNEIRQKLDKLEYTTISEVKSDLNQVFVNAKRYNAPGSSIFLDAKRLHKTLKDAYAVITGEAPPPDDDDVPPQSSVAAAAPHVPAPAPPAPTSSQGASTPIPGTNFAKRGPTIKPWLTRKLAETVALRDSNGRRYADGFQSLPDKKAWPEYYSVITHPMAFENVSTKVAKRAYTKISQFIDDVNVIFANAQFFNEESSRIWKDAKIMQNHFVEVMKEVPPEFVPPRKYNTVRRRAEQEALAKGLPLPPHPSRKHRPRQAGESEPPEGYGDEYEDGDESNDEEFDGGYPGAFGGPAPFDLQTGPTIEDGDPFGILDTMAGSRGLTPAGVDSPQPLSVALPTALPYNLATSSPALSPAAFQMLTNPNQLFANPAPFPSPTLSSAPTQLSALPNGAASRGETPMSRTPSQGSDKSKPRMIAKLPSKGEPPSISRFLVRTTPGTLPITFDNSAVRQHSISVAAATERIEFTPFFRRTASPASEKGKEKEAESTTVPVENLAPDVKICARPAGVSFVATPQLPTPDGPTHSYVLVPKAGLNTVEFLVTQRGTETAETEVYRVFLTK